MISRQTPPLITASEVAEIELFILKRLKERTLGAHASAHKGPGFNFVGMRDWEPGDRLSSVDWAQSSLTRFSPIITREFEQMSSAAVVAVADASLSTRCGGQGASIAASVVRAVATVGFSAVLLQDTFGVMTFDENGHQIALARQGLGRSHVLYCLDLCQRRRPEESPNRVSFTAALAGGLRKTSLVPVISDFLFADAERVIAELSLVNATHDVFVMMIDARFAYRLPSVSEGWMNIVDVETGQTRVVSRREWQRFDARVREWQEAVVRLARDAGLDIVQVGLDRWEMETALAEFVFERRLRKM